MPRVYKGDMPRVYGGDMPRVNSVYTVFLAGTSLNILSNTAYVYTVLANPNQAAHGSTYLASDK